MKNQEKLNKEPNMKTPIKFTFYYQTNYNPEYAHTHVIYAPSEEKALHKFRAYCKQHNITVTDMHHNSHNRLV